jgi:hypothetical protein
MRSATALITIPLPGTAESRAAWATRHVEGLIRPMLSEAIAPQRKDLLAMLCRMRDIGLLDEREIIAHLTFTIAAAFDACRRGRFRRSTISRPILTGSRSCARSCAAWWRTGGGSPWLNSRVAQRPNGR